MVFEVFSNVEGALGVTHAIYGWAIVMLATQPGRNITSGGMLSDVY